MLVRLVTVMETPACYIWGTSLLCASYSYQEYIILTSERAFAVQEDVSVTLFVSDLIRAQCALIANILMKMIRNTCNASPIFSLTVIELSSFRCDRFFQHCKITYDGDNQII